MPLYPLPCVRHPDPADQPVKRAGEGINIRPRALVAMAGILLFRGIAVL